MSEYLEKLAVDVSCTYPWNCPIGVLTAETMYTGVIRGGPMFVESDRYRHVVEVVREGDENIYASVKFGNGT